MKVPSQYKYFNSLVNWVKRKKPDEIFISLNSKLRGMIWFQPDHKSHWENFRGIPIIYEGLSEHIDKLFKPQTKLLLKQRINEILRHGFDGKDLVIPMTGFSVTFNRKDIINAIYKTGKI